MNYAEFLIKSAESGKLRCSPFGLQEADELLDKMVVVSPNIFTTHFTGLCSATPSLALCIDPSSIGPATGAVSSPLNFKSPLFISGYPIGVVPPWFRKALAMACSTKGLPVFTREGIFPEEKSLISEFKGTYVACWEPSRFGMDASYLKGAGAVEIAITGSFIPSVGTKYPAEVLTEKIAAQKGIHAGKNIVGPERHLDMESALDLKKHILLIREITEYKVPVIVQITGGDVYEEVKFAIECGADAVHLICMGKTSFGAPHGFFSTASLPVSAVFGPVRRAFEATKSTREKVKVIVSGGVRDGLDAFKVLCLGADAVGIELPVFSLLEHLAKPPRTTPVDYKEIGIRIANLIDVFSEQISHHIQQCGLSDLSQLSPDLLRAVSYDCAVVTGLKIAGYNNVAPIWMY
ncbi:MAG: glutamate synthase-related protein [Thermoplasmata archaeon]